MPEGIEAGISYGMLAYYVPKSYILMVNIVNHFHLCHLLI